VFVDLTQYLWILWLVLVVVFVIIELLTLEFTFLMIATGTLIGGLGGNLLHLPWWAQIGAAAVISALLLFTIRPFLLRALRKGADPERSNLDRLPGLGGRVVVDFVEGRGQVKLDNGETWTSRLSPAAAPAALTDGDRVVVVRIDGATAEVVPAHPPAETGPSDKES
jgi:membrane protein implicated in regulation of membrane protease activity